MRTQHGLCVLACVWINFSQFLLSQQNHFERACILLQRAFVDSSKPLRNHYCLLPPPTRRRSSPKEFISKTGIKKRLVDTVAFSNTVLIISHLLIKLTIFSAFASLAGCSASCRSWQEAVHNFPFLSPYSRLTLNTLCDDSQPIRKLFTFMALLLRITLLHELLTTVLAATLNSGCQLLTHTRNDTKTSVIICGGRGWKAVETSVETGVCHIAPAGNVCCEKKIGCTRWYQSYGTTKSARKYQK